jgi:hypothetical protein
MQTKPHLENISDPSQSDDQVEKSIKETSAKTAEWFLAIVGLTYACGFLIVFTFLKSFGINTIEFIEAKYIHIGSLFVMACITIILPMYWQFVLIKRWLDEDEKKNRKEVKDIVKKLLSVGQFWKTVWERIIKRFFWLDWHMSGKHGIHATFPAIGSAVLMMWCFLVLLTFARPDFMQVHPKLVFFNLLFPLTIIALAIPADWIEAKGKVDFPYPNAQTIWRWGNRFLRIFWTVTGPTCLFCFFWFRTSFDAFLRFSIPIFFFLPIFVIIVVWCFLFFWQDKTEIDHAKKLRQRLTAISWVLYPIQWILFLGQCWFFFRVVIFNYLGVSLREVFVGKDWFLFDFLWGLVKIPYWTFRYCFFNEKHNLNSPVGGFTFIFFTLLFIFFAFRNIYRIKKIEKDYQSEQTGKNKSTDENKSSNALKIIATFCLLGVLFYFSILSFARCIYPYIPAVKGGGDYTLSRPVQLAFDTNIISSIPQTIRVENQSNCLILLDANSSFVFLAATNDAGGPTHWRSNTETNNRPTVYEIRRDAIISITYTNPSVVTKSSQAAR